MLADAPRDNALYLVFRGQQNISAFAEDLLSDYWPRRFVRYGDGHVYAEFLDSFERTWTNGLEVELEKALSERNKSSIRLVVSVVWVSTRNQLLGVLF